jgi:hypothetical protein
MPRIKADTPENKETNLNMAVVLQDTAALNQMGIITNETEERVFALAQKLGYAGALTVGGVEDEIRFYQHRTVETMLELGKRLLILKEISPHGEFEPRLELLGFALSSAYSFMNAAKKAAKSPTAGLLASQVKDRKAFFELITHDDSTIEALGELDDFDRMSASQLREHARQLTLDKQADEKLLADKSAKIDKLSRHIKKATPDSILLELQKEATALMNDALGCVRGQLRQACIALKGHAELYESGDQSLFMAGLLGQVQADLKALRDEFNLPDVSNAADAELVAEMAQWNKPS